MNEKQFTIIWVVALVLILLAGSGAIWYLQFDQLVEREKELASVKSQVAAATQKKLKIPVLQESIKGLKKEEIDLMQHIPNLDRAEYDVFADKLDDLRRKAGVSVARATWTIPARATPVPGRPARNQPASIHKVQYDINATGSFYQLLRYINLLEQQSRFIGVESFTFSKAGIETPGPGARAAAPKRDLKIVIYSYTYKQTPVPFVISAPEPRAGKSTDIPD